VAATLATLNVANAAESNQARIVLTIPLCPVELHLAQTSILHVTVGLSNFTSAYYNYSHVFHFDLKRGSGNAKQVTFQVSAGVYEAGLQINGPDHCTAQNYVAGLGGHTHHVAIQTITGNEDPLTPSVIMGELGHHPGAARIVRFASTLACGGSTVDVKQTTLREFADFEDGAYYLVLPLADRKAGSIALRFNSGATVHYLSLPLRYASTTESDFMNGKPAFTRYDVDETKLRQVFWGPADELLCIGSRGL
jgi:hypothetical protein